MKLSLILLLAFCPMAFTAEKEGSCTDRDVLNLVLHVTGLIESGKAMSETEFLEKSGLNYNKCGPAVFKEVLASKVVEISLNSEYLITWQETVSVPVPEKHEGEKKYLYGVSIKHIKSNKIIAKSW